ncbi:MAG: class F sortase [Phycicoccus sp.]|nr:class F sortase [Phycicoccus sp.]NMM34623.1 class F sortase [Phycicoccus sp.]
MAIVATLFATIAILATGCSIEKGGPAAERGGPAAPVPSRMAPSEWPSTVTPFTSAPHIAKVGHLARSKPVRLRIPAIGVDSALMDLGLRADGTMEVPPGGFPAGWYTGAPTPGELGPAIIAGHIDWKGPGVFYHLANLRIGDQVTVTRADGSKPVFRVTRVSTFSKDQFPTALVYGNLDHAALRLITCGGSFNSATGHYEDNIVAFADLISPAP